MLRIGALLKQYRLNQNKTQQAWVDDIMSTSFYSKVEHGEHRISAEDLFEILRMHHIKPNDFFEQISSTRSRFEQYNDSMITAFFNHDVTELQMIAGQIASDDTLLLEEKQLLSAVISCIIWEASNKSILLDGQIIDYLKDKFFSLDNWDNFKLTLYANIMSIYDLSTNQEIVASLIRKDFSSFSDEQQHTVLIILINLIGYAISEQQDERAKYYLTYVNQVQPTTENAFQKSMALYYTALINYREKPIDKYQKEIFAIIDWMSCIGFEDFSKKLINYFLEEKEKSIN